MAIIIVDFIGIAGVVFMAYFFVRLCNEGKPGWLRRTVHLVRWRTSPRKILSTGTAAQPQSAEMYYRPRFKVLPGGAKQKQRKIG
jgi:hypothetical protein